MTWSIIARDEGTGRVGIIVASRFFAVGAIVPYIKTGVGAIATQAFINPFYGPQGLALLQAGASAEDAVKFLTTGDESRPPPGSCHGSRRPFAAFTGQACIDWCGHEIRSNFSVAGNILAGPQVIEATIAAYESGASTPFARG